MMARGRGGRRSLFGSVGGLRPGRSVFNLSHERKFTCDMGQLIPVLVEECVPGDRWMVSAELVMRMGPMLAPILHEINATCHWFFYPNRLAWPGDETVTSWEKFISGGPDGLDASTIPVWSTANTVLGSLWDYMGLPIGVAGSAGFKPVQFPLNAYNAIYNEFYRDETLIAKVTLTQDNVLYRTWEKDYFTSARPWTQLGTPPSLPFSGSAVWAASITNGTLQAPAAQASALANDIGVGAGAGDNKVYANNANGAGNWAGYWAQAGVTVPQASLNANTLTAATFGVSDLRLSLQVQHWQERNARGGIRYIELLGNHFGVNPRDDRLQRPEYLGGFKSPIIVSEVLQTTSNVPVAAGSPTPGGTMFGHGLGVARGQGFTYNVVEHGFILGIFSIMPRPGYSQGMNRQLYKTTRYDYYWPEFAHLGEQPVFQGELFLDTVDGDNKTVFGYQGRYDELRYRPNVCCGQFAKGQLLDYWHLSREFAAAPGLNQTFLECKPGKRVFADQSSNNAFYVNLAHKIRCVRPLPFEPTPGLMDHF